MPQNSQLPCFVEPCTFFLMNKRKEQTRIIHGRYDDYEALLRSYNQDLKYDIYFAVNRTDLLGRRMENITHLRAFYAEYDKEAPVEWRPFEPSILVESSPGRLHAYWLLKSPVQVNPTTSIMYLRSLTHLISATGGDMSARDLTRVLRVPGFVNTKRLSSVHIVKETTNRYSFADFCDAWPGLPETKGQEWRPVVRESDAVLTGLLPPEKERIGRYARYLQVATWPEAGRGLRNGWLFRSAAAGLRDFALEAEQVVSALEDESSIRYPADWDELEIERIVRNASRSASAPLGRAYLSQSVQIVMED